MQYAIQNLTEEKRRAIETVLDEELTKSGKIRGLYKLGIEVKDIAKILDLKYNFVYNIVAQCIKEGIVTEIQKPEPTHEEKMLIAVKEKEVKPLPPEMESTIVQMWIEGKESNEISETLKIDFDYVLRIVKQTKNKLAELARPLTGNNQPPMSV